MLAIHGCLYPVSAVNKMLDAYVLYYDGYCTVYICYCFVDAQTRRNILQGLQEARSRLQRLQEDPNAKYIIIYCVLYSKEFEASKFSLL